MVMALALAGCVTGYSTTSQSPVDKLDGADRDIIEKTIQQALEKHKTGESSNWINEANGHRGTVTPTRTYAAKSGAPCREFQQTVTIDGRTTLADAAACRGENGTWRKVGSATRAAAPDGPRPYPNLYDYPYQRYSYSHSYGYRGGYGHRYRYRRGYGRYHYGYRYQFRH